MIANWPTLAMGAALLLFPLPLFYGKGVRYRELDRSWDRHVLHVAQLPWHWVDLVRGVVGTILLMSALGVTRRLTMPADKVSVLVLLIVLGLAVLIQTVASKAPDAFNPPFVFVAATILPLYPLVMALLVLLLATALARAFHSGAAFFGAQAIAIAVLGHWLYPKWAVLGLGAVASIPPLLLPMLFQRELMLAHRADAEEVLPAAR